MTRAELHFTIKRMTNPKEMLKRANIVPNRALGQNFLIDSAALTAVAELACPNALPILEIGAGTGALTAELAGRAGKLAAVEIDKKLAELLRERFAQESNVKIIRRDFLKLSTDEILREFSGGPFGVAANLPYYITSPVCAKLIDPALPVKRMALMMQEEAAERFAAKPKDRNYVPLTILARQLFDVSAALRLSPASYYPKPEVNSVVLLFERKSASMPGTMPGLVRAAFAMRRKTLRNNLGALIGKNSADAVITAAGIDPSARAETLDNGDFVRLAERYEEYLKNR